MPRPHRGQDEGLDPDRAVRHRREGDGHDLGGEDEIRLDGALDLLVLELLRRARIARRRVLVLVGGVGKDELVDLLGALVAEEEAAEHQERGDGPGRDEAENEGRGQQVEQLVLQRADRDPPDDRQFPVGREAHHVSGRHRRIVDHDAGRLGAGFRRLRADIVQGGRSDLGEAGDVVQQCDEARAHGGSPVSSAGDAKAGRFLNAYLEHSAPDQAPTVRLRGLVHSSEAIDPRVARVRGPRRPAARR
jgi:hypothetical protein